MAQEKSQSEYLKITQEKEQQESLALEELELQKKAILTESENKLRDLQQEAETYRTVSLSNVPVPELWNYLQGETVVIPPINMELSRAFVLLGEIHMYTHLIFR